MEVVDVLGDQQKVFAQGLLQLHQRVVGGIGRDFGVIQLAAAQVVEALHQPGVALKGLGSGHLLEAVVFPQSSSIAKGANARFGGNARPGQNHDARLVHPSSSPDTALHSSRLPWSTTGSGGGSQAGRGEPRPSSSREQSDPGTTEHGVAARRTSGHQGLCGTEGAVLQESSSTVPAECPLRWGPCCGSWRGGGCPGGAGAAGRRVSGGCRPPRRWPPGPADGSSARESRWPV